jgi:hypothetical protein
MLPISQCTERIQDLVGSGLQYTPHNGPRMVVSRLLPEQLQTWLARRQRMELIARQAMEQAFWEKKPENVIPFRMGDRGECGA